MIKETYQTGIQKIVYDIVRQSKKMGLDYITKQQIVQETKKIMTNLKNPNDKVGQALHELQKKKTFRPAYIKKVYGKTKRNVGWTIVEDKFLWKY